MLAPLRRPRPRSPRWTGFRLPLVFVLMLGLAVAVVPPQTASATEIGSFDANFDLNYQDYTMINASSTPMVVKSHGADYPDRRIRGNELYDNTALAPGDHAEWATSDNTSSEVKGVNYTWLMLGTKYQVVFRSYRVVQRDDRFQKEHITCDWYENGDFTREIDDAPYWCAVSVGQGQYGHTTEWITISDKDITALDDAHQAATLQMVDKLCSDSNNGLAYPTNCVIGYDLTGRGYTTATSKGGLPTIIAQGLNCSTTVTGSVSNTQGTKVSNTLGWSESTSVAAGFKVTLAKIVDISSTVTESFGYNGSTTTVSTDATTYSEPIPPRTEVTISATYDVLKITTNLRATIANTTIDVRGITLTLRKPDSVGKTTLDTVALTDSDCP